ncbi:MAG: RNA polymerase sigma factor [Omnitrophica WOR_2 bacterium]
MDMNLDAILYAQSGEPAAFSALVETYQNHVYHLCYRMLGNIHDAEDAAQETFLRVFRKLNRYNPAYSFEGWLLAIACHYCIDLLRKKRATWLELMEDVQYPDFQNEAASPEELTIRRERNKRVQALLSRLAPRERAVIILYYWYDYPLHEIAQMNGETVQAVKSRLHRARKTMAGMVARSQPELKIAAVPGSVVGDLPS